MKNKAFTLIELLVVVAIIGILAAVGVVSFNKFTPTAKENIVRHNHSQIVRIIKTVLVQCDVLGVNGIIDLEKIVGKNNANIDKTFFCNKGKTNTATMIYRVAIFLNASGFKNPYFQTEAYVNDVEQVGSTLIGTRGEA